MTNLNQTSLFSKAVGLLVTAALIGVPAAAMATPQQFPEGQSMVVIPCEESPATLYTLDSSTGDASAIGSSPIDAGVCYSSAKFDPVSREIVTYDGASNDWSPTTLVRLASTSGEVLGNINLTVDESGDSPDAGVVPLSGADGYLIDSITYDSLGNLFVFLDDHKLYYARPTDDPDTRELQFLLDTPRYALASAEDPTNPGTIYALFEDNDYDVENNRFYAFAITYADDVPVSATMGSAISSECRYSCFVLNIDESGVAWLQNGLVDVGLNLSNGIYTTNFEGNSPSYTRQRALLWQYYTATFVPTDVMNDSGSSENGSGSGLANTGANSEIVIEMGLAILIVGIGLLLAGRVRRFSTK